MTKKSPAKDISIEYAHIYTNNKIGEEHRLSLEVLQSLKRKYDLLGKTMSLVVMVDDYSFPDPTFDYDAFSDWLASHNLKPDLVIRESQLIPACDEVLKLIENDKLRNPIEDYIRAKKYPCSLFIAAWYLVRLGKISHSQYDDSLTARKLMNILPESFKPFEDKGLEIISATGLVDPDDVIEYEFLAGRLLA
jgi:hypothetical protein